MKNLNTSKKSRTTFIIVLAISMFIRGTVGFLESYLDMSSGIKANPK